MSHRLDIKRKLSKMSNGWMITRKQKSALDFRLFRGLPHLFTLLNAYVTRPSIPFCVFTE
ncbi:TPA: hypothetical protein JAN54_04140 [Legionella pneumophila]|nr:hypothetical protein [Legionella pneumophila]